MPLNYPCRPEAGTGLPVPPGGWCGPRLRRGGGILSSSACATRSRALEPFQPLPFAALLCLWRPRVAIAWIAASASVKACLNLFGTPLTDLRREILPLGPVADRLEQAKAVLLILFLDPGKECLAILRCTVARRRPAVHLEVGGSTCVVVHGPGYGRACAGSAASEGWRMRS